MKRYALLLAALIGIGALALAFGRRSPHSVPSATLDTQAVVALSLTVTPDGRIDPETSTVPKDHLVRLIVTNRHHRRVQLTLMGYQDRFAIALDPDSVWRGELVADRPGDGFAWVLEGEPKGRLRVTGSHLVEGHR